MAATRKKAPARKKGEPAAAPVEPAPQERQVEETETALVRIDAPATALEAWSGAAERAVAIKRERDRIIKDVLEADTHYGVIPGTKKPTLLKAGAEAINDALNLAPVYTELQHQFVKGGHLIVRYRCELFLRGSDVLVASGIGSCSTYENKYRWRQQDRTCPECGQPAIIKGKAEYGGGWVCFHRKGGCGAKYPDGDRSIEGQTVGRVENPDLADTWNTVAKMGQKRALVAATLNLGFSSVFTQDIEDNPPAAETAPSGGRRPPSNGQRAPAAAGEAPDPRGGRRMKARFAGQCALCTQPIMKGEDIIYWKEGSDGKAAHPACYNANAAGQVVRESAVKRMEREKEARKGAKQRAAQESAPPPMAPPPGVAPPYEEADYNELPPEGAAIDDGLPF